MLKRSTPISVVLISRYCSPMICTSSRAMTAGCISILKSPSESTSMVTSTLSIPIKEKRMACVPGVIAMVTFPPWSDTAPFPVPRSTMVAPRTGSPLARFTSLPLILATPLATVAPRSPTVMVRTICSGRVPVRYKSSLTPI